jgi:hypothetical protein
LHSGDLEVLINLLSGFTLRHWLKGASLLEPLQGSRGCLNRRRPVYELIENDI